MYMYVHNFSIVFIDLWYSRSELLNKFCVRDQSGLYARLMISCLQLEEEYTLVRHIRYTSYQLTHSH